MEEIDLPELIRLRQEAARIGARWAANIPRPTEAVWVGRFVEAEAKEKVRALVDDPRMLPDLIAGCLAGAAAWCDQLARTLQARSAAPWPPDAA